MKRSALPRKRVGKPRRVAAKCSKLRCSRRPAVLDLCRSHATAEADALWSLAVRARDGRCLDAAYFPDVECLGALQADHLIPRSYHATRHMLIVGASLCLAHHVYVTNRPLEHVDLAVALLGHDTYDSLRKLAQSHERSDLEGVLRFLRLQVGADLEHAGTQAREVAARLGLVTRALGEDV